MAREHAVDAIESFLEIERRLESFVNAVTFKSEHARVHSPVLAGLLLECGSLSESIFKSALDNARYNGIPGIANIRNKRYSQSPPFYNIADTRKAFRPDQLYAKKVWFVPRSDSSFPWHAWQKTTGNPKWWKSYNSVKHDRFGNLREAKLGTVMHAMQATFLLLIQTLDFREDLIRLGMIRSHGLNTNDLLDAATEWEPLPTQEVVIGVSALFGYKFKTQGSPNNASDISVFL